MITEEFIRENAIKMCGSRNQDSNSSQTEKVVSAPPPNGPREESKRPILRPRKLKTNLESKKLQYTDTKKGRSHKVPVTDSLSRKYQLTASKDIKTTQPSLTEVIQKAPDSAMSLYMPSAMTPPKMDSSHLEVSTVDHSHSLLYSTPYPVHYDPLLPSTPSTQPYSIPTVSQSEKSVFNSDTEEVDPAYYKPPTAPPSSGPSHKTHPTAMSLLETSPSKHSTVPPLLPKSSPFLDLTYPTPCSSVDTSDPRSDHASILSDIPPSLSLGPQSSPPPGEKDPSSMESFAPHQISIPSTKIAGYDDLFCCMDHDSTSKDLNSWLFFLSIWDTFVDVLLVILPLVSFPLLFLFI